MTNHCFGFSLSEVLITLLVIATLSLALLKQQWQSLQSFNQIHMRSEALNELDNASERELAKTTEGGVVKPFQLQIVREENTTILKIGCRLPGMENSDACQIQRRLIIL